MLPPLKRATPPGRVAHSKWRRKMGVLDYFRPVRSWTAEGVREFLDGHSPQEYNLVDVRTPGEYEKEHLPGARLIPLGELENRLGELDPEKVTIAY